MLELVIAIGTADSATNGVIESFDNAAGKAFVEVIQELIPPVPQRMSELYQLNQARGLSFIDPSL